MVLLPKQWKSRSSPGFEASANREPIRNFFKGRCRFAERRLLCLEPTSTRKKRAAERLNIVGAGWSSPVARQAHNLKVAGSNPAPATNVKSLASESELRICVAPDLIRGPSSDPFKTSHSPHGSRRFAGLLS